MTRLTDARNNTPHSAAPLTAADGRLLRAPDLLSVKLGKAQYWEVKSRARADVDLLTGRRQHWMEFAAFRDYLTVAETTMSKVWVVLHEAGDALSPGRWLVIDVRKLREVGVDERRRAASGDLVRAWCWAVSDMRVVSGPTVDLRDHPVPVAPVEGGGRPLAADELAPVERVLRRPRRRTVESDDEMGAAPPERAVPGLAHQWLHSEPVRALDVLRRRLGVPSLPRYSVLRIGTAGVDLQDLLGILHYGIRVLVVSEGPLPEEWKDDVLQAFLDIRLLEWAVAREAGGCSAWVVDGARDHLDVPGREALEAADASGQLNLQQYAVVHTAAQQDVAVVAGAGTGKTETMSERIVFLLATGAGDPVDGQGHPHDLRVEDIGLITFTRESAAEMRHRIARTLLLRQRLCRRCALPVLAWMLQLAAADIATIHSFARRVAGAGAGSLGLGPGFRVSSQTMAFRADMQSLLSPGIVSAVDRHGNRAPAAHEWQQHVQAVWDALENNGVDLVMLAAGGSSAVEVEWGDDQAPGLAGDVVRTTHEVVTQLSAATRRRCLRDQVLPTNQLVLAAAASLEAQPDPPVRRYRYVFVDEFQDTDPSQMALLLNLRQRLGSSLFVVGDVKQGIYRFRGAEGNAFSEMDRRTSERGLPRLRRFSLTRNFRSGQLLLDSLHGPFARWGARGYLPYGPTDRLLPRRQDRDTSAPLRLEDLVRRGQEADTGAGIADRWRALHPDDDVGVLCRQNWQALAVKKALQHRGIPCELRVGGSFFTTPAVREVRVLLEAVTGSDDDASLLELCETRWAAGLLAGEAPLGVDVEKWGEKAQVPSAWADRFARLDASGSFERADLQDVRRRVDLLRDLLRRTSTMAWLVEVARALRPVECELLGEEDDTERARYGRCFDHLVTLLDAQFGDGTVTVERMLSWVRLQVATNRSEDEPEGDLRGKVVALTVHKAKGLEFDRVVIPYTSTAIGPPRSVATRAAVLREADGSPRLLWRWQHGQGKEATVFSNVPADDDQWGLDDLETLREETRLLYVALTRAHQEVVAVVDPRRRAAGTSGPTCWSDLLRLEED